MMNTRRVSPAARNRGSGPSVGRKAEARRQEQDLNNHRPVPDQNDGAVSEPPGAENAQQGRMKGDRPDHGQPSGSFETETCRHRQFPGGHRQYQDSRNPRRPGVEVEPQRLNGRFSGRSTPVPW